MVIYNEIISYYDPPQGIKKGAFGARIYLIKGETGQILIETSTFSKKHNKNHIAQMERDNIDIKETKAILLTHAHPDHVRGTPFWVGAIGNNPPIYIHESGIPFIKESRKYNEMLYETLGDFYYQVTNLPKKAGEIITDFIWGGQFSYDNVNPLNDLQEFDLGNVKITSLHTPGHAPEHMCYKIMYNGKKYIISGDLISFKDMGLGDGLQGLASFNTPTSSLKDELDSLRKIYNEKPDVLMTMHYGIFEKRDLIDKYFQQALEEGSNLIPKTIEVLSNGPLQFKELTKKVIDFPKYLSGISPRTNSMNVILKELMNDSIVEKVPGTSAKFRLCLHD